jgi:hypothetical protein
LLPDLNQVQLLYLSSDRSTVRSYERELTRRHITVQQIEASQFRELLDGSRMLSEAGVIFCTPQSLKNADFVSSIYAITTDQRALGWRATLLVTDSFEIPHVLRFLPRIQADYLEFDLAFEELLRFVLGPLPSWLQLYCRPNQIATPTGATWWADDIVIADEYYGHVVRIKGKESSILIAGLDEPYHIHLDRQILLISHLGGNEVIVGRVLGGTVWKLWAVDNVLGQKLRRPHGVFQGNGYSLIADTDNHRILWKQGHFADDSSWASCDVIDVKFPCGVYGEDNGAWIVDTFNHIVVNINLKESIKIKCNIKGGKLISDQLCFPVAVCTWNDLIFISDEQNRRLRVFKQNIITSEIVQIEAALGAPFIGLPLGIAINRHSCLLIADRLRGCCWVVDLKKTSLVN